MPVFRTFPIELTVDVAFDTLQLFIVGDALQNEALEALNYLKDFIDSVMEEYKV